MGQKFSKKWVKFQSKKTIMQLKDFLKENDVENKQQPSLSEMMKRFKSVIEKFELGKKFNREDKEKVVTLKEMIAFFIQKAEDNKNI